MKRMTSTLLLGAALLTVSTASVAHGTSWSVSVGSNGSFALRAGMPTASIIVSQSLPMMSLPPAPFVVMPAPVHRRGLVMHRPLHSAPQVYAAAHPVYRHPPVYRHGPVAHRTRGKFVISAPGHRHWIAAPTGSHRGHRH